MEGFEPTSGQVTVDDTVLRYVVEGCGQRLLVVGSATYYPRTFSAQVRQSCRLAFMDLRHFARRHSALPPADLMLDTYANDIETVRNALGWEKVILVGHSHHGNLALEYAKRNPHRVSGVVMIGSPPVGVQRTIEAGNAYWSEHASIERKMILRRNNDAPAKRELDALATGELFVAQYIADAPKYWYDPHYDATWLWQDVPIDVDAIGHLREAFVDYELTDCSGHMSAPVLVITGRYDYAVPHILWEGLLSTLPSLTYRLFEQSGHTPQLEEPALFDATLLNWLRALGSS